MRHIVVGADAAWVDTGADLSVTGPSAEPAPAELLRTAPADALQVLRVAAELAARIPANLNIVAVCAPTRELRTRRGESLEVYVDGANHLVPLRSADQLARVHRRLSGIADLLIGPDIRWTVQVRIGNVNDELRHAADETDADVIVVGGPAVGSGSTSRLVHGTHRAVLVVPHGDGATPEPSPLRHAGRIALAVDDSPQARRALDEATQLARATSSEVVVMHVRERVGVAPATSETPGHARELVMSALRTLEQADVPARGLIVDADCRRTARALVKVARDQGSDVLVMGTRGLSGFVSKLVGSVSQGIVGHTELPVMVVG